MGHSGIPDRLGHFRVVEELGEGGMGTVYVGADDTLDRRVALKVIRAEHRLDPTGKARFLREARILSRLDHPGICKLYDYIEGDDEDCLVLELVEGTSLRRAINEASWTYQDRLEIARQLLDVLVVVHGQGIIHRDLTPRNVMITPSSDVKVLDFGLARVADPNATVNDRPIPAEPAPAEPSRTATWPGQRTEVVEDDSVHDATAVAPRGSASIDASSGDTGDASGTTDPATTESGPAPAEMETRQGTVLGTAAYMSPEQARAEPVTAASDMFSFGLILQELLTGRPPYPPDLDRVEQRRRALFAETEPVRGLPADITTLIRRLTSLVPASRPSSVDAAEMLKSIIDRPRRQRRRRLVAAIWLILAIFGAGMTLQYLRAERESDRAERQAARAEAEATAAHQVSDFLIGLFEVSDPGREDLADVTARELLDAGAERIDAELANRPVAHARLAHTMGVVYHHLGNLERSRDMLQTALAEREATLGPDHPDVADTLFELGLVDRYLGAFDRARDDQERGLRIVRQNIGPECLESARFIHQIAVIDRYQGDLEASKAGFERALAIYESEPEVSAEGIAETLTGLAHAAMDREQFDEAERLIRRALELDEQTHGPDSLEVAGALSNLGNVLLRTDRTDEAERAIRRSLEITEERLGPDHAFTAGSVNGLAHFYYSQGRYEEAAEQLRRALQIYETVYGPDHHDTGVELFNLGSVLARQGELDEAVQLITRSLDIASSTLGPNHPEIATTSYRLAILKQRQNQFGEAEALYRRALAIQEAVLGPDSPAAVATRERLAGLRD